MHFQFGHAVANEREQNAAGCEKNKTWQSLGAQGHIFHSSIKPPDTNAFEKENRGGMGFPAQDREKDYGDTLETVTQRKRGVGGVICDATAKAHMKP